MLAPSALPTPGGFWRKLSMPLRANKAAWAAAGIFTVGAVTGLAAPQLMHTGALTNIAAATSAATSPANASASATPVSAPAAGGPIPLTTAPNYRAIVAQNNAAVV